MKLERTTKPQTPKAPKADPRAEKKNARVADELSSGRGSALRKKAQAVVGQPLAAQLTRDLPTFKVGALQRVTTTTAADPAVAAAAKKVEAAWTSSADPKKRSEAVTQAIEAGAAQFAGDPAKTAQYLAAISPTVTKLAADLGARKDDHQVEGVLKRLDAVAAKLGPDAALALGASIAQGLPDTKDLYYIDDALGTGALALGVVAGLADAGKLKSAGNLAGRLEFALTVNPFLAQVIPPTLAGPLSLALLKLNQVPLAFLLANQAVSQIDAAAGAAKKATEKVDALQSDLNQELQQVPEEFRHDYQEHFWASHQDALDGAKKANAALKATLDAQLPSLKALAAVLPDVAKKVADALAVVAQDPAQADFVTSTIDGLKVNGAFPESYKDAEEKLVGARSAAAQGKANLLIANGDTAGAAAVLEGTLDFLKTTKFFTKGIAELREPLEHFVDVLARGDLKEIKTYLTDPGNEDLKAISTGNKALGTLITGVSVALALVNAKDADGLGETLKAILEVSEPGSELIAKGLDVLSNAVNKATLKAGLGTASEVAETLAKGLGKIAGVLGVVTGVIQGIGAYGDAFETPSVQNIGAAAAATLTTLGGALSLFPGSQPIGGALLLVGSFVGVLSGFIGEEEAAEDRADETEKLLKEVFAEPGGPVASWSKKDRDLLAKNLSTTTVDLEAFRKDAGLSPAQFYDLAAHSPALAFENFRGFTLSDVSKALGLKGAKLVDFLKSKGEDFFEAIGPDYAPTEADVFNDLKARQDAIDRGITDEAELKRIVDEARIAHDFALFATWVKDVAG